MLLVAILAAHAAPPPGYAYTRPDGADPAALDAYGFPRWPERAKLYAADQADVYDAPGGKRTAVLAFGEAVRVEEAGAVAMVDDRVDQWYRVSGDHSGWVFGGMLTPYAWQADMDGDGEQELVTAAWNADFTLRVRIFEPNLRAGATMHLDVDAAGGAYISQQGSIATVELIPASKAGIALVHIHMGVEACADFRDDWISYSSSEPVKIGRERVALSQSGLIDPPNDSSFTVEFSGKRKTAYVTRSTAEAEGQPPSVISERYVLRDGVFLLEENGAISR